MSDLAVVSNQPTSVVDANSVVMTEQPTQLPGDLTMNDQTDDTEVSKDFCTLSCCDCDGDCCDCDCSVCDVCSFVCDCFSCDF